MKSKRVENATILIILANPVSIASLPPFVSLLMANTYLFPTLTKWI
jgi:hypothetical protein